MNSFLDKIVDDGVLQDGKKPISGKVKGESSWSGSRTIIVVLVLIILAILSTLRSSPEIPIDKNHCPIDDSKISGRVFVLMDLSNKLDDTVQSPDLRATLTAVATNLNAYEKLGISRMQANADVPRKQLGAAFCSPNLSKLDDHGELVEREDCEEISKSGKRYKWHPNIAPKQQEEIRKVCEHYIDQSKKARDAANIPEEQGDNRSYVVGAIEDLMVEAANSATTNLRLLIFSDMLQNSNWFSQYGDVSLWEIDKLLAARETQNARMGPRPENPFQSVLVCYLSRPQLATARNKIKHQELWADYFADTDDFLTAEEGLCADKAKAWMQ